MRKKYGPCKQVVTGIVSLGDMHRVHSCNQLRPNPSRGHGLVAHYLFDPRNRSHHPGVRATIATEGMQFALFSVVIPSTLLVAVFRSPTVSRGYRERAHAPDA